MLGYVHDTAKIWRLWNPEIKRVIQASDVYFDEEKIVSIMTSDERSTDVLKAVMPEEAGSVWDDEEDTISDLENESSVQREERKSVGPLSESVTRDNEATTV